jgi:hypothetical protein
VLHRLDDPGATSVAEDAVRLARDTGYRLGLARSLLVLGTPASRQEAEALFTEMGADFAGGLPGVTGPAGR